MTRKITLSLLAAVGLFGCYGDAAPDTPTDLATLTQALEQKSRLLDQQLIPNPTLTAELRALAGQRIALLKQLARRDPRAALRAALPAETRAALPEAIRSRLEGAARLRGTIVSQCALGNTTGEMRHYLRVGNRTLRLFSASPLPDVTPTAPLVVSGLQLADEFVAETIDVDGNEVAAAGPQGSQKVLAVLISFKDKANSFSKAQVQDVLFKQTNDYYLDVTQNKTSITGDVVGPYTISIDSSGCAPSTISTEGKQAAKNAGIALSGYTNFMFIFPKAACGWAGLGNVRGSTTWINASVTLRTVGHELGHNFGAQHSHALECGLSTAEGQCSGIEYGHTADIMGRGPAAGHFNAFQKELLGYLDAPGFPPITFVDKSGDYTIGNFETHDSTAKALKIFRGMSGNARTFIYVEYRQPIGADKELQSKPGLTDGLLMSLGTEGSSGSSFMLDMTPQSAQGSSSDWYDAALPFGKGFADAAGKLEITAVSGDGKQATVRVKMGPGLTCQRQAPTVTIDPNARQVAPGTFTPLEVTITSNDSAWCQSSTFDLATNAPSGWTAKLLVNTVQLSAGSTAKVRLDVTVDPQAATGPYEVSVTAQNNAAAQQQATAKAAINVTKTNCINANPHISLTPLLANALPGASVEYELTVRNDDVGPCPATSFARIVSVPGGWQPPTLAATQPLSPGAWERMKFSVASPIDEADGNYNVTVTATSQSDSTFKESLVAAYVIGKGGGGNCTRKAPTLSVTPDSARAKAAGESATFWVTLTNQDADTCAPTSYSVTVEGPAGFAGGPQDYPDLIPGESQTISIEVNTPSDAASGLHAISFRTAHGDDASLTAQQNAKVFVGDAYSVDLKAAAISSSLKGEKLRQIDVSVTVTNVEEPIENQSVDLLITDPTGKTLYDRRLWTNRQGMVTIEQSLGETAAAGTYNVSATAEIVNQGKLTKTATVEVPALENVPDPPTSGGGCAISGRSPSAPLALVLLLVGLFWIGRHRRQA